MLLESWQPVTHDFGLIQAPLETVVRALREWHSGIGIRYRRAEISGGLEAALTALLPLSTGMQRKLFVQTASTWTAFYQNGIQGSDPFPAMSMLARTLEVLAMRVCVSPPKAVWPATIWEVYGPPSLGGILPLGYRRSIAAANDGGRWTFVDEGPPFPFEELEAYTARRKRDRFTPEHLKRYVGHFGIRPFEDDFLLVDDAHPALLLDTKFPPVRPSRGRSRDATPEFTLREVIEGVPWNPAAMAGRWRRATRT